MLKKFIVPDAYATVLWPDTDPRSDQSPEARSSMGEIPGCLDHRESFDHPYNAFNEQWCESDLSAFTLLKILLHLISPHNQVRNICFCKGRYMRAGMFTADHMVGDQFPHTIHFYDLNIALVGSR